MRLLLALALFSTARALSSWYTPPGGTPAGSVAGDKIRGVNLGGWFILENWMMPEVFEVSPLDQHQIPDEWTYCTILGKDECLSRLQAHWDTFVTEDDFKRFANYADTDWLLGMDRDGGLRAGQLPYLERALNWASTYGLDVMMDLHGLPGGQNGQDNQGQKGPVEFQANSTNMDRAMMALANMTKTVTADRFNGVLTAIELTNEPYILEYQANSMEFQTLADYYTQGYATVRASEHIVSGNQEVMVVIHDAFQPLLNWEYFFEQPSMGQNWTNYAIDTHIYDGFGNAAGKTNQEHLDTICGLASNLAAAQAKYPIIVGEFSLGTNTYCVDYQSCFGQSLGNTIASLTDYQTSLFLRQFWEVQADVYELASGWIFWSHSNQLGAPWSWSQSAAQNWIPQDPTEKIWPFYTNASSYCLHTYNPIDGDQNLPAFPGYANNISNIDIAMVQPKNATVAVSDTTSTNTTSASSSYGSSPTTIAIASTSSHITSSPSSTTSNALAATTSAKSGANKRTSILALLGIPLLGTIILFST